MDNCYLDGVRPEELKVFKKVIEKKLEEDDAQIKNEHFRVGVDKLSEITKQYKVDDEDQKHFI